MNREKKYVVSLSGGKDSTAMLLRLIEEGHPVDYILFCDTGLEFPEMYEHLKKLERAIGRPIVYLRAEHGFFYYFSEHFPNKRKTELRTYHGLSWLGVRSRWCTGILKVRLINSFLKNLRQRYDVIEYVGIAADEKKRIREKCYPLVDLGMTERDCLQFCYDRGFDWGGLYRIFSRVSCWCCPMQPISELCKLYFFFPQLWEQLEAWDQSTWRQFRKDYSVLELRWRFELEQQWEREGKLPKGRAFYRAFQVYKSEKENGVHEDQDQRSLAEHQTG